MWRFKLVNEELSQEINFFIGRHNKHSNFSLTITIGFDLGFRVRWKLEQTLNITPL